MLRKCLQRKAFLLNSLLWIGSSALALGYFAPAAHASKQGLNAIELYDGRSGAAYVQLTNFFINDKLELRQCTSGEAIDHSAYGKLNKVVMAPGGTLERGADGILRYSTGGGQGICVVPENVKFDHGTAYSPSELADQANPTGSPTGPSTENVSLPPPIKKGVTIVLVATLNTETADFLRAKRASDITIWQAFITRYPSTSHLADAKSALALLYVQAGQTSLAAWLKSSALGKPSYTDLKNARAQADLAVATKPSLDSAGKLTADVSGQLTNLTNQAVSELNAWHTAMSDHTPGYPHLQTAKALSDAITLIDPKFGPGQTLATQVQTDVSAFETAVASANTNIGAGQYDKAFAEILPYRSFADEEPRIGSVVDTVYSYHYEKAKSFGKSLNWQNATEEYQKAIKVHDTGEAEADFKTAQAQLAIARDKAAAQSALATSQQYEQAHDPIRAYEALYYLSAAQRKFVQDDIDRLGPGYADAASAKAKSLLKLHGTITGPGDESQIELAYEYLDRAYEVNQNDTYVVLKQVAANDLSKYLLATANKYFAKPGGSGTELGWAEIVKAMPYKADNLADLRDAQNSNTTNHNLRSRMSVRVQFLDQTSQRDSAGFVGQIESAIIGDLESSGISVRVLRATDPLPHDVEPDFQLEGDVIQHHVSAPSTPEQIPSEYVVGTHDVPNEEWNKADQAVEAAKEELVAAQGTLSGAVTRGKHVSTAQKAVTVAEDKVNKLISARDLIPKTKTEDIPRPYTYTKKTIKVNGVVQLRFSISQPLSEQTSEPMAAPVTITKEDKQTAVVLSNVSPADRNGVVNSGSEPDLDEFKVNLETVALQELVEAVRKHVALLPQKIYDEAYRKENEGDMEGAGESYLRYLNLTHEDGSSQREHAKKFLSDTFLLEPTPLPNNTQQASTGSTN
jgi:hypothetical protein